MSRRASAADVRVEPAIEHLNESIERLNDLEAQREAATNAAKRAEMVIGDEIATLNHENAQVLEIALPYVSARGSLWSMIEHAALAAAKSEAAKEAEADATARFARLPADDAYAEDAKRAVDAARLIANESRHEATCARKSIQREARRLGMLRQSVQRAGYAVPMAMRAYDEYVKRRRDLEGVLHLHAARMTELAQLKENASLEVSHAMANLESLSEEIHNVRQAKSRRTSAQLEPRTPLAERLWVDA